LDTGTHPFYHSTGTWNERLWHYKNPKVDAALDQARLTADAGQQQALYGEFQRLVAEDYPSYIAYAVAFVVAYRADMRDHTTHPMRWVDLRTASLPK
ncbi:MAG: ABC transporter substrate-binding protein, partial [Alphaproteobacteria bacterium]|nr:ABC transporter substrate-binding protein [Alphaproteobacteria bacterium]